MGADGKRPCGNEPRTRNETSMKKADMGRHGVVGDRTTGRFRCGESGIPAAAQVKGRRVTEPPYELRSVVIGVEQREVGRWNRKVATRRRIAYCRKARNARDASRRYVFAPAEKRINRCRWALVTERLSNESARQTSFTATQVPRVRICHRIHPWRAGCGRSASPVRREGEVARPLPTPIVVASYRPKRSRRRVDVDAVAGREPAVCGRPCEDGRPGWAPRLA